MLILLDENLLSRKLKKSLVDAGHTVKNVEDMGWRGVKDRELLALANFYPFDVFITADKNLPYQQNLSNLAVLEQADTRLGVRDSGFWRLGGWPAIAAFPLSTRPTMHPEHPSRSIRQLLARIPPPLG